MKLPKYWPVLEPENINQDGWPCADPTDHGDRRCWESWVSAVLRDEGLSNEDWRDMMAESKKFLCVKDVPRWNDATPAHIVAKKWNDFGRHLGYDVDHPEDA